MAAQDLPEHDFDPGAVPDAELLAEPEEVLVDAERLVLDTGEDRLVPDAERSVPSDDDLDAHGFEDEPVSRFMEPSGDELGEPVWIDDEP